MISPSRQPGEDQELYGSDARRVFDAFHFHWALARRPNQQNPLL
jgi:hypothetical protein